MPTNTRWKCPFCDKRLGKEDLVIHIDKNHYDELPQGFTPLRAAFHAINRKDFSYTRHCRMCKAPTNWDEDKGRYDFLCGKEQCHTAYVALMRKNMGEKCGINRQTKTAEGLEKMLANRKISGRYKFSDGTEFTYTGSYEKKALEFFDNVLHIKSYDLMVPGPTMTYKFDGVRHIYIPDMYYIPYNLIIEVKAGGNKPNTAKSWEETRMKTLAKEKAIINETDFNYIRLTDNNFAQILQVFADLKMSLVDAQDNNSKPERVIHVNENMVGAIQAAIPPQSSNDVVVVNYLQNNVFAGKRKIAVSDDIKFDRIFIEDDKTNTLIETDKNFLKECKYDTYIVKDAKLKVLSEIISNLNNTVEEGFLYETVFGHKQYTDDQILFEDAVIPYEDYYANMVKIQEQVKEACKDLKNI